MLLDEMVKQPSFRGGNPGRLARLLQPQVSSKPTKIELTSASVKWPVVLSENEENTITNVTFKVRSGQLLTVVGPIGSGKVI